MANASLESRGYYMSEQWNRAHRAALEKDCLGTDFEDPGQTNPNPVFQRWIATPSGTPLAPSSTPTQSLVLQCVEMMDVSQSMTDRAAIDFNERELGLGVGASTRHRLLKLLLTDGHVRIPAMEFRSCPCLDKLLPGGKLRIRLTARLADNGSGGGGVLVPDHRRNMLLLTPDRVELCGGVIARLHVQHEKAMIHLRAVLSGKAVAVVEANNASNQQAPRRQIAAPPPPPPPRPMRQQVVAAPPPPPQHVQERQTQAPQVQPPPPPPPPRQVQVTSPNAQQNHTRQEVQASQSPRSLEELVQFVHAGALRPGDECVIFGTLVGAENVTTEQIANPPHMNEDDRGVMRRRVYVFPVWIDDGQGSVLRALLHPSLVTQCLNGVEAATFDHWISTQNFDQSNTALGHLENALTYLPGVKIVFRWIGYSSTRSRNDVAAQEQEVRGDPLFHITSWSSPLGTMGGA